MLKVIFALSLFASTTVFADPFTSEQITCGDHWLKINMEIFSDESRAKFVLVAFSGDGSVGARDLLLPVVSSSDEGFKASDGTSDLFYVATGVKSIAVNTVDLGSVTFSSCSLITTP